MVPIGVEAAGTVLAWSDGLHRTMALHHAVLQGRPGLWGDHPVDPSSVVWLRDGGDQWEAFAAGFADPALNWLEREATGRRVVLAAPAPWESAVRRRFEPRASVRKLTVQTWFRPARTELPAATAPTRALNRDDRLAFEVLTPPWASRSWGGYTAMLTQGMAVGVPTRSGGLAAAAWVVEADQHLAKLGVATAPQFRRLGLGRAAASDLLARLEAAGRWQPLWVTIRGHAASVGLAHSLGFASPVNESVLWWDPA